MTAAEQRAFKIEAHGAIYRVRELLRTEEKHYVLLMEDTGPPRHMQVSREGKEAIRNGRQTLIYHKLREAGNG